MDSSFGARIDELAHLVGGGELVGTVVVDQIYAAYQHLTKVWISTIPEAARRSTSRRRSWKSTPTTSSASPPAS